MFLPIRFRTNVQLSPRELADDNFDDCLKGKLQKSLEGVCSRYGYIKPGSIDIMRRSAGMFIKQHFNGYIKFEMVCKGEVCNPANGMVIEATVKNKNALGFLAECSIDIDGTIMPVLDIIIPRRAAGVTSEVDLDAVNVGDIIYVQVLGKRYQLNDKKISIIGKAVNQPGTTLVDQTSVIDATEADGDEDVEDSDVEEMGDDDESEGGEIAGATKKVVVSGGDYDLFLDGGLLNDGLDGGGEGEEDDAEDEGEDGDGGEAGEGGEAGDGGDGDGDEW